MDLEELKQRLEESRKRSVQYHGATLQLRIPNNREVRLALRPFLNADQSDDAGERALVAASIVSWQGVRVGHVERGGSDDELAFSPEAAQTWLDWDGRLWTLLSGLIFASLNDREDAEKNSATASHSSAEKQTS
jgi:hypothetical protein